MHERTTQLLRDGLADGGSPMGEFIGRVTPLLIAVARRCLRSLAGRSLDPEDVVQDAWASCLPRLATLQPHDGRLTPVVVKYLSTAIQRRARDLMLAAGNRVQHLNAGTDAPPDIAAETMGIVSRAVQHEQKGQVLAAIEALEPTDRDCLVLLSIEQVPLAEAALILGISKDATKQRHKRARDRLRRELPESVFDELD